MKSDKVVGVYLYTCMLTHTLSGEDKASGRRCLNVKGLQKDCSAHRDQFVHFDSGLCGERGGGISLEECSKLLCGW